MDAEVVKLLVELVSITGLIAVAVINAIVGMKTTKYANQDKAKKEVNDFILSFWTKQDIEKLVKTGEINSYDKNSQKKIQEYYEKLVEEEKKSEVTFVGMPDNSPIEVDDDDDDWDLDSTGTRRIPIAAALKEDPNGPKISKELLDAVKEQLAKKQVAVVKKRKKSKKDDK